MREVCIAICASFILLGCHGKSAIEHTQATSTLKPVNTKHEPGMLEQYS